MGARAGRGNSGLLQCRRAARKNLAVLELVVEALTIQKLTVNKRLTLKDLVEINLESES